MLEGLNDTSANFMAAIDKDEPEVSPSSLFGAACILEGVPFINGAPQNTFVPGLIQMAVEARPLPRLGTCCCAGGATAVPPGPHIPAAGQNVLAAAVIAALLEAHL